MAPSAGSPSMPGAMPMRNGRPWARLPSVRQVGQKKKKILLLLLPWGVGAGGGTCVCACTQRFERLAYCTVQVASEPPGSLSAYKSQS
eukprot:3913581-Prymnesium_polylepis.1